MAEASAQVDPPSWASQVLCRYFLHGVCRAGNSCRYSHDLNSQQSSVCKFYQLGQCTYGDRCRYDHVKPPSGQGCLNHSATGKTAALSKSSKPSKPLLISNQQQASSGMVTLKKKTAPAETKKEKEILPLKKPDEWVKAAEFVPGQLWQGSAPTSYLKAAQSGIDSLQLGTDKLPEQPPEASKAEMCPFAAHGECRYGENCAYMHGDICEMCGRAVLHPFDMELRAQHEQACVKEHEEDMELSFAVQRSQNKACGICMENVLEKSPASEQRFGILSNCSHCFCLSCIRKWRAAKQFENKIVRACPECRVTSDFVTPSKFWVDDEDDKKKLIEGYKTALSKKPCKYFNKGSGECPFNENCFYQHAYPDGKIASPKPRRRRRRQDANGDLELLQRLILWDFFEERENISLTFDFEDTLDDILFHTELLVFSSDSDFSDDSY